MSFLRDQLVSRLWREPTAATGLDPAILATLGRSCAPGEVAEPIGTCRRQLEWLSALLMDRGERVARRLLPRTLPPLPFLSDARLATVVEQARARPGSNVERFLWLERLAATWRGSNVREVRDRLRLLRIYLARYKSSWAPRWISERLRAFARQPLGRMPLAVEFSDDLGPGARKVVARRLARAERIFAAAVHPELHRRWPAIAVKVSSRFDVAGIVNGPGGVRWITLRPDSTVKDILHELGHMVGFHGGLHSLATAHAVRARRAYGSSPEPLRRLLPWTTYSAEVKAYAGGYVDQYMGRYYSDGYTEVLSLGVERFSSTAELLDLFYRDGDYVLLLITVLQTHPDHHRHRLRR